MKLGSLFDGAGGFPLAAQMVGITPVWASEIESYPIAVTTKNFPNMKHLGDITKINGAEIEPVDIISFGSRGQTPGLFWQTDIALVGEYLMLNIGAYPQDVKDVFLLDVLEKGAVQEKYYLNAKTCAKILERCAKKGKVLPDAVEKALREQAKII